MADIFLPLLLSESHSKTGFLFVMEILKNNSIRQDCLALTCNKNCVNCSAAHLIPNMMAQGSSMVFSKFNSFAATPNPFPVIPTSFDSQLLWLRMLCGLSLHPSYSLPCSGGSFP